MRNFADAQGCLSAHFDCSLVVDWQGCASSYLDDCSPVQDSSDPPVSVSCNKSSEQLVISNSIVVLKQGFC